MPGKIEGDCCHLELAGQLDGQGSPGVDVGPRLMEQEHCIGAANTVETAHDRSPGKRLLDGLGRWQRRLD
jgi:hypothetical protein